MEEINLEKLREQLVELDKEICILLRKKTEVQRQLGIAEKRLTTTRR